MTVTRTPHAFRRASPRLFRVLAAWLVALVPCAVLAAIPATERTALLDLHAATHGAGWTDSTGWGGAAGTECSWHGVTCNAAQTSVVALDLAGNGLAGTLPATLDDLTGLHLLFLGNNAIGGSIPALSHLVELQDLALGSNALEGAIPVLDTLVELRDLNLGNNLLTGPLPSLATLTQLLLLDVSDNRLSGPLPSLAGHPDLSVFNVTDNALTGPLPSLDGLTSLQAFLVARNAFEGPVPDVPAPSALVAGASTLCPNLLTASASTAWDEATGSHPWHAACAYDILFRDGFETP